MKIEPMHPDMEQYFNSRPDEVKNAESADKDMEHLQNIYGKNGDIKTDEKKFFEQANRIANVGIHAEWANAKDKKNRELKRNAETIEYLEKTITKVKDDLESLKRRLQSEMATPVMKADLKMRISNMEKGYKEMMRLLGLEKAETEVIKNTEYSAPEYPYKNIRAN